MVKEFDRRRNLVHNALNEIPRVSALKPQGAFYIFPNTEALGKGSEELTQYLIDEAGIAVVPGTVLGEFAHDYLRISYCNSYENLEMAMDKMKDALKKIS